MNKYIEFIKNDKIKWKKYRNKDNIIQKIDNNPLKTKKKIKILIKT